MCEYRGDKLRCAMKVIVVGPFVRAQSAGHNSSEDRSRISIPRFTSELRNPARFWTRI